MVFAIASNFCVHEYTDFSLSRTRLVERDVFDKTPKQGSFHLAKGMFNDPGILAAISANERAKSVHQLDAFSKSIKSTMAPQ